MKLKLLNIKANRCLRRCDIDGFNAIIDEIRAIMYPEIWGGRNGKA